MAVNADFLRRTRQPDGAVAIDRLIEELHITKSQLAAASGLSRDALGKSARLKAKRTQQRLGELVEIINRVLPWSGSLPAAFAWFRSQPLPSFGDLTAEDLVKAGRGEAVRRYLSRLAAGGYA